MRRCLTGPLLVLLLPGWALLSCTPDSELSNRELFVKYCSECHGEDGRGDESLLAGGQEVDLLASRHLANGDRDFVYHRIAFGYGQMPAYIHKVDPETLERLVEITFELMNETEAGTDGADRSPDNSPDRSDIEDPPQTEGP